MRPETEHVYLTYAQVEALADAAGKLRTKYDRPTAAASVNRALVLLLAYTGIRWAASNEAFPRPARSGPCPSRRRSCRSCAVIGERDRDALLFTTRRGQSLRANNSRTREFNPAVAAAELDVPRLTPHKLRHTAASTGRCSRRAAARKSVATYPHLRSRFFPSSRHSFVYHFAKHGKKYGSAGNYARSAQGHLRSVAGSARRTQRGSPGGLLNKARTTHGSLVRLLAQGPAVHGSPADEKDGLRGEFVAEIDLLESFLTGLLSAASKPAQERGTTSVEEQFARVEAVLSRASDHDVGRLSEYVRQLKDAYLQHFRGGEDRV